MESTEFHQKVDVGIPEEERAVFSLLWYAGLTQGEAAQALDISERTLRRRWRSACVLLYEALDGAKPSD